MRQARPLASAVLLLLAFTAMAQAGPFDDGLQDRTAWEHFFESQSDARRAGALFWANQRSQPSPISCVNGGGSDRAFIDACQAAQRLLAPADARRRAEPDYRRGWNSWQPETLAARPSTSSGATCTTIDAASARLACYDQAFHRALTTPEPATPFSPQTAAITSNQETAANSSDADNQYLGVKVPKGGVFGATEIKPIIDAARGDLERFSKSSLFDASFVAIGRFVGFEATSASVFGVTVMVPGQNGGQVTCFYDHVDERLAAIPQGSIVQISGKLALGINGVLVLTANCNVFPH